MGRLTRAGRRFPGLLACRGEGGQVTIPRSWVALVVELFCRSAASIWAQRFCIALIVEALTSALSGYGRADKVKQDGAAVSSQLDCTGYVWRSRTIPPRGGLAANAALRRNRSWRPSVRMPGARGLALRRMQLANGVELRAEVILELNKSANQIGIKMPQPIGD